MTRFSLSKFLLIAFCLLPCLFAGRAGAQTITDTFQRGPTSAGAVGNSWVDSASAYLITSGNQLTLSAAVNNPSPNLLLRPVGEAWADGTVTVTGRPWNGTATNDLVQVVSRYQGGGNKYLVEIDYGYPTSGSLATTAFKKTVGGTTSNVATSLDIGSLNFSPVTGHEYAIKLTTSGSTITCAVIDAGTTGTGTTIIFQGHVTDTSITAAGQQGIILGYYNSANGAQSGLGYATAFSASSASTPAFTTFAPNSSSVYWSPGNVYFDGSSNAHVRQNATYFKCGFTGTSFAATVDISTYHTNSIAQAHTTAGTGWGQWVKSIDGAAPTPVVVTDPGAGVNTTSVTFASGLAAGSHTIQAWFDLEDETDTYTPKDEQIVNNFLLDSGSTLSPPSGAITVLPKTLRVHGDSITKGYNATDPAGTSPSTNYPLSIYATVLGRALGCEIGTFGLSGQGWTQAINAWTLTLPQSFPNYDSTHVANAPSSLTYDVFAEGTNDAASNVTSAAQAMYVTARTQDGPNTWIIEVVPFNGTHRSELQAALAGYKAAYPGDTKVALIDPSAVISTANTGTFYTVDGTHPGTLLHMEYGAILASLIKQATAPSGGTKRKTQ